MKKRKTGIIEKKIDSIFRGFLVTDDLYMNTPVAYLADIRKIKTEVINVLRAAERNFPKSNNPDFKRLALAWKEEWLKTKSIEDTGNV